MGCDILSVQLDEHGQEAEFTCEAAGGLIQFGLRLISHKYVDHRACKMFSKELCLYAHRQTHIFYEMEKKYNLLFVKRFANAVTLIVFIYNP